MNNFTEEQLEDLLLLALAERNDSLGNVTDKERDDYSSCMRKAGAYVIRFEIFYQLSNEEKKELRQLFNSLQNNIKLLRKIDSKKDWFDIIAYYRIPLALSC